MLAGALLSGLETLRKREGAKEREVMIGMVLSRLLLPELALLINLYATGPKMVILSDYMGTWQIFDPEQETCTEAFSIMPKHLQKSDLKTVGECFRARELYGLVPVFVGCSCSLPNLEMKDLVPSGLSYQIDPRQFLFEKTREKTSNSCVEQIVPWSVDVEEPLKIKAGDWEIEIVCAKRLQIRCTSLISKETRSFTLAFWLVRVVLRSPVLYRDDSVIIGIAREKNQTQFLVLLSGYRNGPLVIEYSYFPPIHRKINLKGYVTFENRVYILACTVNPDGQEPTAEIMRADSDDGFWTSVSSFSCLWTVRAVCKAAPQDHEIEIDDFLGLPFGC